MKKIADILTFELEAAFEKAGYDKQYAKVTLSNRPDLCEYQCNGAMAAAKAYKKAPIMIANDVVEVLKKVFALSRWRRSIQDLSILFWTVSLSLLI
mgnify:FL=1